MLPDIWRILQGWRHPLSTAQNTPASATMGNSAERPMPEKFKVCSDVRLTARGFEVFARARILPLIRFCGRR
jgi:hypothetical protein